jgi:hypothetical protein
MNKIERAIADCKEQIKNLETEKTLIYAEINALRKQLDNLEAIERNDSIPHFEKKTEFSPFNPEIMLYGDIKDVPNTKHE